VVIRELSLTHGISHNPATCRQAYEAAITAFVVQDDRYGFRLLGSLDDRSFGLHYSRRLLSSFYHVDGESRE
jgi:hypothetical protein